MDNIDAIEGYHIEKNDRSKNRLIKMNQHENWITLSEIFSKKKKFISKSKDLKEWNLPVGYKLADENEDTNGFLISSSSFLWWVLIKKKFDGIGWNKSTVFVSVSFVSVVDKFSSLIFVCRRLTTKIITKIILIKNIIKPPMAIIIIAINEIFVEENSAKWNDNDGNGNEFNVLRIISFDQELKWWELFERIFR